MRFAYTWPQDVLIQKLEEELKEVKSEKELWPACQLSCFCSAAGGPREAVLREGQGRLLFFCMHFLFCQVQENTRFCAELAAERRWTASYQERAGAGCFFHA